MGQSIEEILAELRAEHCAQSTPTSSNLDNLSANPRPTPIEALLQKVKEEAFTPSPFTLQIVSQASIPTPISRELEQVSAEIAKERQRQEQAKRQEQERLAKEWLEQLDWLSAEGVWFEKFARNYASNLEAAIAYLFG